MDDVTCSANASSLMECSFIVNHNCRHSEDAGVRCVSIQNASEYKNGTSINHCLYGPGTYSYIMEVKGGDLENLTATAFTS